MYFLYAIFYGDKDIIVSCFKYLSTICVCMFTIRRLVIQYNVVEYSNGLQTLLGCTEKKHFFLILENLKRILRNSRKTPCVLLIVIIIHMNEQTVIKV